MSSMEFVHWVEWAKLRHVSPLSPWWRNAQLIAAIATVMGSGKRKYRPDEFMPKSDLLDSSALQALKAAQRGNRRNRKR